MTVGTLLTMAAAAHPDRTALGGAEGMTFGELHDRAVRAAQLIRARAAGSVAFIGLTGPAWPLLVFACAYAGVPVVPLNYRLSRDRLHTLTAALDDPLVVADDAYVGELVATGRPLLTTAELIRCAANAADPSDEIGEVDDDVIDAHAPAVILFTSGTTAAPKGVVLRHANLFAYAVQTVEFGAAAESECALVSVPPYHVAGVGTVLTNAYAGRRVVNLPDFEATRWIELVRSEGVTQAMVVPTMLARIVERLGGKPAQMPTLRSIAYGGSAMPPNVLRGALAAFPDVGFVNSYGLTETSSTIAVLGPEDHRAALASTDDRVRQRLHSVGLPVPGVEIRIVDDAGSSCGPGVSGELQVRGLQVSGEYQGIGSTLTADGWFATRDHAMVDEAGYLFILGRTDDTIIRGGENIAPAEIESVLLDHPLVRDAGVVGEPDDEWGQRAVAYVVLNAGADICADALRAWMRKRVRGSRTPDSIVFREALPYNAMGKLLRRELADQQGRRD